MKLIEKVNLQKLPKNYYPILYLDVKTKEELNKIIEDNCLLKSKKDIPFICDACGKEFYSDLTKYRQLFKTKYSMNYLICGDYKKSPECHKKKQQIINSYRAEIGDSPAIGHIVSEEQKEKWRNTSKKSGKLKEYTDSRKGKTVEEIYGEEKGKAFRQKVKEAYDKLEVPPHKGFKHSKESKKLQSKKRKEYINSDRYEEKKFISELTGELLNAEEKRIEGVRLRWSKMNVEEREDERLKQIKTFINKNRREGTFCGNYENWLGGKDFYLSSYELAYFIKLNREKAFFMANKSIYIPYIHPKDLETHFYSPDVLIFSNENREKIIEIQEIKPYQFTKEGNKLSEYQEVTFIKMEALNNYCRENNIVCRFITEYDIIDDPIFESLYSKKKEIIRIARGIDENKKDNK